MLLKIENLTVRVAGKDGPAIVADAGLSVGGRQIVALVGGSGSGKTTIALSILRLLPPSLRIESGRIVFGGRELLALPADEMRRLRGKEIGMVFQEPLDALNPLLRIGDQIDEVLRYHSDLSRPERKTMVAELLSAVGINAAGRVAMSYPHQLSGGMRQRAMIAQAIAGHPKLLIADEPTSNLDVTLQARIMELFRKLKDEFGFSILLITHDLGMVRRLADYVYVMKQGRVVEEGKTAEVLHNPAEEYTQLLLKAVDG